jgi:hypothetical protein
MLLSSEHQVVIGNYRNYSIYTTELSACWFAFLLFWLIILMGHCYAASLLLDCFAELRYDGVFAAKLEEAVGERECKLCRTDGAPSRLG